MLYIVSATLYGKYLLDISVDVVRRIITSALFIIGLPLASQAALTERIKKATA